MREKIKKFVKFIPLIILLSSIYFTVNIILNGYLIKNPENIIEATQIKFLENFNKNIISGNISEAFQDLNSNVIDKNDFTNAMNDKQFREIIRNTNPKIVLLIDKEKYELENFGLQEGKKLQFLLANKNGESTWTKILIGEKNNLKFEIAGFEFTNIKLSIDEILSKDKLKKEDLKLGNYFMILYIIINFSIWVIAYFMLITSKYSSNIKYYFLIFLFIVGISYDWNSSELLSQYNFISLNLSPIAIKKNDFLENWKIMTYFPIGAFIFLIKIWISKNSINENGV